MAAGLRARWRGGLRVGRGLGGGEGSVRMFVEVGRRRWDWLGWGGVGEGGWVGKEGRRGCIYTYIRTKYKTGGWRWLGLAWVGLGLGFVVVSGVDRMA